jgi:hypothetical protein
MKLSTETVLARANEIYKELGGHRPECESKQIRALAQSLVEEINKMFARVELTRTVKAIGGFERPVKNSEVQTGPVCDSAYFKQDHSPNKTVHS